MYVFLYEFRKYNKIFSKMNCKFFIIMKEKEVYDMNCYKIMVKYDLLLIL